MKKQFTKLTAKAIAILAIGITLTLVPVNGLFAQHNEGDKEDGKEHKEAGHRHKNHVALFTGATTNLGNSMTLFSLGLEYERRVSDIFGIGLMGEYLVGESTGILAGIPLFVHPVGELKLVVAPLMVWEKELSESADESESIQESKMKSSFAIRMGAAYEFHVGKLLIGPEVNIDIGKTTAMVYGLTAGMGF